MLSSVLRSKRAITVNIEIMRAFVKLRQMLASNAELSRRLDELESKYDKTVQSSLRRDPALNDSASLGPETNRIPFAFEDLIRKDTELTTF
jgi:hypothetical protein